MIHLANDPNVSRSGWRPSASDDKLVAADVRRAKPAHPWPFLSRPATRPAPQDGSKPRNQDSGS